MNGNAVCAFEDKELAEAALINLTRMYVNDKTVAVEYDGEVTIERKYVRADLLADRDTALKFLVRI